jgi:DNA polymerase type B, organellar and viral
MKQFILFSSLSFFNGGKPRNSVFKLVFFKKRFKINFIQRNKYSTKSIAIKTNKKWGYEVLAFEEFLNKNSFLDLLMSNLKLNSTNSILFKIGFKNNIFYMVARQIGIVIKNHHNFRHYINIHRILIDQIESIMSQYGTKGYPNTVTFIFKDINLLPELSIIKTKDLAVNKIIFKDLEIKDNFSSKYLPLTANANYFGYYIGGSLKLKYFNKLVKTITFLGQELSDTLKDMKSNFEQVQVFLKKKNNKTYIILSRHILNSNNKFIRSVYDLKTGICLYEVVDSIFNEGLVIRKHKELSLTIYKDKLIKLSRNIQFNYIKDIDYKISYKGMSNPHFGTFDVETYDDTDGKSKIYALGYVTLLERNKIKSFYLSDISSLDSNLLVIICIDSMLISKYHNYNFYVHNLGKFDVVFIHKILKEYNLQCNKKHYILKSVFRDGVMLKLSVSIKINNKKYIKINFIDSINYFNANKTDSYSLYSLCKDFKVSTTKGIFPYKFVNKDTLNYVGVTPSISFYNSDINELEYNENYPKSNWNLRQESINYLEKDLVSLLEVLEKFNSSLFINHNIQMTENLTISRIALTKYLKYYLNDYKLPLINKLQHFNFINFGYYGGITEVYIPHGTNLKYYDVNSLYPYVALNPMPGINCTYVENIDGKGLELDNLFGFFYARVKTNSKLYLGILPVKTDLGLIFPNGEFEGVWSSEELKLAKENGYEILVIKGYDFNKIEGAFTNYINELYELKSNTTGAERAINKSLLNNLLGRFGMNIIKPITKSVNKDELDFIISTRIVKSFHEITNNDYLITYIPIIDEQICSEHGLDYIKVLAMDKNYNIENNVFKEVSIAISAMVTSYARVFMSKIKLEILKRGGKIYYSDTDSIVTDIELNLINSNLVGKDLGQFKLEYLVKEAYFISNKTYCLSLYDGRIIIKTKGVLNTSLTLEDFKTMYYLSENVKGIRSSTETDYKEGFVSIKDKEVILNYNSYTKREKIYSNNLWTDTKPLVYNNLVKSIVPIK